MVESDWSFNYNRFKLCGKLYWKELKELKIELPHDPAVLLLGIYLKKTIIQKDTDVQVTEMLPLLIHPIDYKIKCVLIVQIQINMGLLFLTFTRNNI